ncbi:MULTISPECIES: hypothetical protein [Brevibacillus]
MPLNSMIVLLLAAILSTHHALPMSNLLLSVPRQQMLTPEEATQVLTAILSKNPALGPVKITSVTYANGQYYIRYIRETNCESGTHIIDAYTGETVGGTRSQC